MQSDIGKLTLFGVDNSLVAIAFDNEKDYTYKLSYLKRNFDLPLSDESSVVLEQAVTELTEYFLGKRKHFTVKTQFRVSNFAQKVIDELCKIEYGKCVTYSDIALYIGAKNAFRAVGNANNHNPIPIIVPCHRVNARDGMVSGYAGGLSAKRKLQELEQTNCLIAKSEILSQDELINPSLTAYIRGLYGDSYSNAELEKYAQQNNVPISKSETLALLSVLLKLKNPKTILEIGTAIGYGTAFFAQMCPESKIVTVERDKKMLEQALKTLKDYKNVTVVEADGVEYLENCKDCFDFIYIDSAKGQYVNMYENAKRVLSVNGVSVYDNVLYKGICAELGVIKHKNRTMVRNLVEFNSVATQDKHMQTAVVAVGDGVMISIKKGV